MSYTIKIKRGTEERWNQLNLILSDGEPGLAFKSNGEYVFKIGDGVSTWSQLSAIDTGELKENTLSRLNGGNSNSGGTSLSNPTNGLSLNSSNEIGLGGSLSGETIINTEHNQFVIGDPTYTNGPYIQLIDTSNFLIGNTSSSYSNQIQINDPYGVTLFHTNISQGLSFSVGLTDAGLSYGSDYSQYFGPNSLVDKNYVDNHVRNSNSNLTSSVSVQNGIYYDNNYGAIMFGGNLAMVTNLSVNYTNTFRIINGQEQTTIPFFECDNNIGTRITAGEGLYSEAYVQVKRQNDPYIEITATKTATLLFDNNSLNVTFTDLRGTPKGIEYASDYSANYTDRSLVDKAYVDSKGVSLSNYNVDGDIHISTYGAGIADNSRQISIMRHMDNDSSIQSLVFGSNSQDIIDIATFGAAGSSQFDLYNNSVTVNVSDISLGLWGSVEFNCNGVKYNYSHPENWDSTYIVNKQYVDDKFSGFVPNLDSVLSSNSISISTDDNTMELYGTSKNTLTLMRGDGQHFNQSMTFGYYTGDDWILFQNNGPIGSNSYTNAYIGTRSVEFYTSSNGSTADLIFESQSGLSYGSVNRQNWISNSIVDKQYVDDKSVKIVSSSGEPGINPESCQVWFNPDDQKTYFMVNTNGYTRKVEMV